VTITGSRNSGSIELSAITITARTAQDSPKVPLLRVDINFATPSIIGPATNVANKDATNEETLVAPTALTEKLYGGAEKICDNVMEIKTSQDMQMVKSNVAHMTTGLIITTKGRKNVRQKDT
jgi:hypothetical protein